MRKTLRVKDLPPTKRPREKLAAVGVDNLSDEELLAIILGSGTKKLNVISLSKKLLKIFPLKKLPQTSQKELSKIDGVGSVRAGKISASIELGRRAYLNSIKRKIESPKDVLREVEFIKDKSREYVVALYLNARHELVQTQTITIGGLNQNYIEPRDVFAPALSMPCAYIVLSHNHPSGDPTPSEEDILFTEKIKEAGELLGCALLDHIIVASDSFVSMKEVGAM